MAALGRAARAAAGALAVGLLAAGCGDGEEPPAAPERIPALVPGRDDGPRASPRWERIAAFSGTGPATTRPFAVPSEAIQWRVRWRCRAAELAIAATPRRGSGEPQVRARCPARGEAVGVRPGRRRLEVRAAGGWSAVVEQQVDTPLVEPPLPAMRARGARVVARGRFSGVDEEGRGHALLHRLAGGRLALRLEDFFVPPNTDLFVWISPARRPRTSRQAAKAPYTEVAALKSTMGDHNYLLPPGTRASDVRSVIIWCAPQNFAYAAAGVGPA